MTFQTMYFSFYVVLLKYIGCLHIGPFVVIHWMEIRVLCVEIVPQTYTHAQMLAFIIYLKPIHPQAKSLQKLCLFHPMISQRQHHFNYTNI